jgi:hypothetical protein
MIRYGYICLRQFPKSEKFTLAADIKRAMMRLLELIIRCNMSREKYRFFNDIDVELELLRGYIRLAKELEFLPFNKYENWSKLLVEIGKMVGGWRKSCGARL